MNEHREMQRHAAGDSQASGPTIGMFTGWLAGLYQMQWLGAVDAARAKHANLITFAGRELGRPNDFHSQGNVIYQLVGPQHLDGLIIWTTTLQAFVGRQQIEEFCQQYQPLPMVSVEQVLPGLPSLLMDNQRGMREAVSHLIEAHGLRRIAFIRGPATHPGAQERYQGYLEALAEHGLPLDPALVSPFPRFWRAEEASAMVQRLLDEQTAGIEAIVAANDNLALGVLSALEARHIRVPGEIAVVGFDNSVHIEHPVLIFDSMGGDPTGAERARAINPGATTLPLTTVQPPFYELGKRAVELLLARLRGEDVPAVVTLPTKLIVRRSCGCFSEAVRQLAPQPSGRMPQHAGAGAARPPALLVEMAQISTQLREAFGVAPAALVPDWAERLLTAFIGELRGETTGALLVDLDELARASMRSGDNPERWWPVLFTLRSQTAAYLVSGEIVARAEALWQRVQVLMGELTGQFYLFQQVLAEKRDELLRDIGQELITTFDISELVEILAQALPDLGIERCYLALYEPRPPDGPPRYPTEWSRSILVYEQQQVEVPAGAAMFRSQQLAPDERLRREQPYSMVVEPLYFRDQQLGFMLFEVGPRIGWIYEVLRGQVSSALQGALLVEREKGAVAAVQEKNKLLQQEIRQRQQAEAALQKAHDELEQRVAERTAELAQANEVLTEQITERQHAEAIQAKLEAQLRQAQKMEAIGQLAGGVAHDFNNLLVVINGYSDLLLSELEADNPLRADLAQIQQAGERAAALTRQLLAFSRQQLTQPRVLNLNRVVISLEPMLRRLIGEDISLVTSLAPALRLVTADYGQIEQMILNLVVNARDAMPDGGTLTIATTNIDLDQAYAQHYVGVPAGPYVLLRVGDTGIGMDAETQSRIFEPFFTTKPQGKGTGLGLATVFGIVQQSGGHIMVTSAPGQGTMFTIYLPQSAQAVEDSAPERDHARPALAGAETILVVEDDLGVRGATLRFLKEHGYNVLEAADGREALHLCQQHKGPIDLVITDVVMPHMSGRELAERLARVRPNLPVLYVSGYTDSTIIRHGLADASIALLQKPFTADALAQKVRELLDRR